jgi:hypothetical protein
MACFKPSDMEVDFQSFFFLYNEILDSLFLFFANRKYCTIHSNARLSKVCSSILILTYFLLLRCRFPSSFPITRYYFDDGRFPSSGKSVENEGEAVNDDDADNNDKVPSSSSAQSLPSSEQPMVQEVVTKSKI